MFEGNIDFVGQQLAGDYAQMILVAGTVLSFFAGYFAQSLKVTFSTLALFVILGAALIIPPWPMYRKHPVLWLPPVNTAESAKKKT